MENERFMMLPLEDCKYGSDYDYDYDDSDYKSYCKNKKAKGKHIYKDYAYDIDTDGYKDTAACGGDYKITGKCKIRKDQYGQLVSDGSAPREINDPFTGDRVRVYTEQEARLLDELYQFEDELDDIIKWYKEEPCDYKEHESDVKYYEDKIDDLIEELARIETDPENSKAKLKKRRAEQKIVNEKEAKRKLALKKLRAKQKLQEQREQRAKEKKLAERQANLENTPEDIKDVMDGIF